MTLATRTSSPDKRVLLVITAALTLLTAVGCADPATESQSLAVADGQATFERYCAVCHGTEGDGQGPASYLLFPKPRNFNGGQFKLRSTPMGMLPTDADLVQTVSNGIPGTAMFAFGELLGEATIVEVVEHVKSLHSGFATATPPTADQLLQVPTAPELGADLAATGRRVYENFRCAQCHGPEGEGDGPAAPLLTDSEGDPFPAAQLTSGIYKSGGRPEDLYRVLQTGMAGTPMPSYADAIDSDDQAWALIAYVLSLAPGGQARPIAGDPGPIQTVDLNDEGVLTDPQAPAWDAVPPHRVVVRPLWFRSDYSPLATVRAARVGERLAVLLEWNDATHDERALRTEDFSDASALQFSLSAVPPFLMGQPGPGNDVEIWYWRAARQAARAAGRMDDVDSAYPDVHVDQYPVPSLDSADGESASLDAASTREQPGGYLTARAADNPVSTPELATRPIHSMAAAGYGSLTTRPADEMRAKGDGVWANGVYRVVFSAPLQPQRPALEADFSNIRVPLAVAIWDGSAADRNGTKLVSQWVMLEIPARDRQ